MRKEMQIKSDVDDLFQIQQTCKIKSCDFYQKDC